MRQLEKCESAPLRFLCRSQDVVETNQTRSHYLTVQSWVGIPLEKKLTNKVKAQIKVQQWRTIMTKKISGRAYSNRRLLFYHEGAKYAV